MLSCFIGCEKSSSSKPHAKLEKSHNSTNDNIVELLSSQKNASDFNDILNSNVENVTSEINEVDSLSDFYNGSISEVTIEIENEAPSMKQEENNSYLSSVSVLNVFDEASVNALNKSENENAAKDATIASLKELNQELLEEIKFLREFQSSKLQDDLAEKNSFGLSSTEEQNKVLENKLLIQQNRIDQLLRDNQNLESRVLALTQNPYSKIKLSNPSIRLPLQKSRQLVQLISDLQPFNLMRS